MTDVVVDTHALLWFLSDSPRLSTAARDRLQEVVAHGGRIRVPSICLVELVYLVEKKRLPATALEQLLAHLKLEVSDLVVTPLDQDVAETTASIPRDLVPDMPDRIIAATALSLGLALVTRDRRISSSSIETVW